MLDKTKVNIPKRFLAHPVFNTWHCGMNFGFMARRGYYSKKETLAQPAKMAAAGVTWSTLNANLCQEKYCSTKVFLDFDFSSGELELYEIAKVLHDHGIKILLKPCLTPLDGSWMGAVNFPEDHQIQGVKSSYWQSWFASFTEASKYFADFAERIGAEALIIGAEYLGTEDRTEEWSKVIAEVRKIYSNPISYEFMPPSVDKYVLKWFEHLDFLCYSCYPPACEKNANPPVMSQNPHYSVDDMVKYLSPLRTKITTICERFGNKPLVFSEIGTRSAHGSIMNPGDFLSGSHYDGAEQADYMEAVFRTFALLPQCMGLYWWKWDETQNRPHYHTDSQGDMGFTIAGKPAEAVFKKWALKK